MSSAFSVNPNPNRASLLSGLRTGGVRPPQSAAPAAGAFDPQQLLLPQQLQQQQSRGYRTAAVDGPNNSFAAQQQFSQQYQLQQAMQLEMLKLQAIQAQQYQAELLRQQQNAQQQQQQQQQQQRRTSFQPPATAGPTANFDLRSATLNAQMRRSQAEQLKQSNSYDQVPMTAGLGGKFGTRSTSMPLNNNPSPSPSSGTTVISGGTSLGSMASNNVKEPSTPSKSESASSWRRGSNNSALNALRERSAGAAKSTPAPINVAKDRSSPPPALGSIPAPVAAGAAKRPKPLSFSLSAQKPMIPEVLIDTSEADEDADDASSTSGTSASSRSGSAKSSPTTSNELLSSTGVDFMQPPLSPREEATKKLYEGLGIGRPRSRNSDAGGSDLPPAPPSPRAFSVNMAPPQTAALFPSHNVNVSAFPQSPFPMAPMPNTASLSGPHYAQHRLDRSQPKRQPRGPPSGANELGTLNFAARSPRLPPSSSSAADLVGSMQGLAVEAY